MVDEIKPAAERGDWPEPTVGHKEHSPALSQYLDSVDWDSQTAGLPSSVWWLVVWLVGMLLAAVLSYG